MAQRKPWNAVIFNDLGSFRWNDPHVLSGAERQLVMMVAACVGVVAVLVAGFFLMRKGA